MANEEKKKKRRTKRARQDWDPHWTLKTVYTLGGTLLSALKIASGAALTVVLILLVCGVVFVGTLGDYLQNDILTEASDWSIDDYDLEKTSFLYYVDSDGNIQQLQQIPAAQQYQRGAAAQVVDAAGQQLQQQGLPCRQCKAAQ